MMEFTSDAAARYFGSLPPAVQESIVQCGRTFSTEEELRTCAAQLLGAPSSR